MSCGKGPFHDPHPPHPFMRVETFTKIYFWQIYPFAELYKSGDHVQKFKQKHWPMQQL